MVWQAGPHHPFLGHGDVDPIWIFGRRCRCRNFGFGGRWWRRSFGNRGGTFDWLGRPRELQLLEIRYEGKKACDGQGISSWLSRVFCRQGNDYVLAIGRIAVRSEIGDV